MLSAEKMKLVRLLNNVTQKEIGDMMGVSKNYISMIENGKHYYSSEQCNKYLNAIYKIAQEKKRPKKNIQETEDIVDPLENIEEG